MSRSRRCSAVPHRHRRHRRRSHGNQRRTRRTEGTGEGRVLNRSCSRTEQPHCQPATLRNSAPPSRERKPAVMVRFHTDLFVPTRRALTLRSWFFFTPFFFSPRAAPRAFNEADFRRYLLGGRMVARLTHDTP